MVDTDGVAGDDEDDEDALTGLADGFCEFVDWPGMTDELVCAAGAMMAMAVGRG